MKTFLFSACCLLLICCHPKQSGDSSTVVDSTIAVNDISANFKIDTISYQDTAYHLAVDIAYAYPKDDASGVYKSLVTSTIDSALADFKNEIRKIWKEEGEDEDKSNFDGLSHNMFDAAPATCYSDDNIISTSFSIGISHAGAVHGFNGVHSINFDKRSQKVITFNDYFRIKTTTDSVLILLALDEAFGGLRKELKPNNSWEFYGLNDSNFGILKDSLVFNFSDYQLGQGPSMTNCKVSKHQLISLIQAPYK
ncbi:MAG: hypothetical protein JO154_21240 [Chitinophaga sp.]|uniref:hypothetical protein n=1 Tax=Chitinophaga sp. TaxID=1869181 RepID=UPI0025C037A6|nr:hypothetical protein [Chitinophaga sp.]MBV8255141.1 hypothetical protein [Chitinophaga sp.]